MSKGRHIWVSDNVADWFEDLCEEFNSKLPEDKRLSKQEWSEFLPLFQKHGDIQVKIVIANKKVGRPSLNKGHSELFDILGGTDPVPKKSKKVVLKFGSESLNSSSQSC